MRKVLIGSAAILLLVGLAGAQVHFEFHCTGQGNMVKTGKPLPLVYSGQIDGGDLAPGAWEITIPDGDWPPVGDDTVRWTHIWTTYYIYDPGFMIWTGFFDNNGLWLSKTGAGTMSGTCDMTIQIIDFNGNGVLDPDECMDGLSGAVIIINEGTDDYAHLCGDGTYEGFYFRDCLEASPTYMLDDVDFNMQLDLEDCGMSTDAFTWGAVKGLFR
jgi:hypothetical protein